MEGPHLKSGNKSIENAGRILDLYHCTHNQKRMAYYKQKRKQLKCTNLIIFSLDRFDLKR